jgi:hypothetical protein
MFPYLERGARREAKGHCLFRVDHFRYRHRTLGIGVASVYRALGIPPEEEAILRGGVRTRGAR